MSYDIWVVDSKGSPIRHNVRGGTYALGGSMSLDVNVTFNYAPFYTKAFHDERGIKSLNGMKCMDAIPVIVEAMRRLGDDETDNYWDATEGNAKRALESVLRIVSLGYDGTIAMHW